ncbi:MAG TPA: HutD family protein, partial [Holophaga sp.]|nr:HutD family protein [Holophaga sp.]
PAGGSLALGFDWRLSMAEVGTSGPFSRFDGYDRTLLLLSGAGMRLDFEGRPSADLELPLKPVSFSGDWQTSGTLLGGPCRDFNIISRRASWRHRLEVLRPGARPEPILPAAIRFCFCVSDPVQVGDRVLHGQELLRLEGGPRELDAQAVDPAGAILIVVGLDPVHG